MINGHWRESSGLRQVNCVLEPDRAGNRKWDGQRGIPTCAGNHAGHGLVYKDPVRGSHGGPSVFERVPGEAEPRLEVLIVLMVNVIKSLPEANERSGARVKDDETVIAFLRRHVPVVAQAE